jgi:hypothetical protein
VDENSNLLVFGFFLFNFFSVIDEVVITAYAFILSSLPLPTEFIWDELIHAKMGVCECGPR